MTICLLPIIFGATGGVCGAGGGTGVGLGLGEGFGLPDDVCFLKALLRFANCTMRSTLAPIIVSFVFSKSDILFFISVSDFVPISFAISLMMPPRRFLSLFNLSP